MSQLSLRLGLALAACLLCLSVAPVAAQTLTLDSESGRAGSNVRLLVTLEHDIEDGVGGFSFGLDHDEDVLDLVALKYVGPISGIDASFLVINDEEGADFATIAALFFVDSSVELLEPGTDTLVEAIYGVPEKTAAGFEPIEFAELGEPPVAIELATNDGSVTPETVDGGITILGEPIEGEIGDDQMWVPNSGGSDVTVVAPSTASVIETVDGDEESGAAGVAVGANGVVWMVFSDTDTVMLFDSNSGAPFGAVTTIPVGDTPLGIALDKKGDAWISHLGDNTLWKISNAGDVLLGDGGIDGEAVATGDSPRGVAVDRLNNVWVCCTDDDEVRQYDNQGELAQTIGDLDDGGPTGPWDIAFDRDGFWWVTLNESDTVQRRAVDGSLVAEWELDSSPANIVIRRARRAWVTAPESGEIYRLRPGNEPEVFDAGTTPSGIAVDADGMIWVADADEDEVNSFDSDGTPGESVSTGSEPSWFGDPTGYLQANILCPNEDFDGDGGSNKDEIAEESNPFDGSELPPAFVAPVENLVCKATLTEVSLSWTLPALFDYDTLDVVRTDPLGTETVIALEADAMDFSEDILDLKLGSGGFGKYRYDVVGTIDGDEGRKTCRVSVGAGAVGTANTVAVGETATTLSDVSNVPDEPVVDEGRVPFLGDAGDDDIRTFVTDKSNGKIYSFDSDFEVVTVLDSPFGDDPAAGVAFWPEGDEGNGSLFVSKGVTGEATIQQISLRGETIGDEINLTDGGDLIEGNISSLAVRKNLNDPDSPFILANDVDTCDVWAFTSDDPEVIANLSFPHPGAEENEGAFGLNGIAIAQKPDFGEDGGTVYLLGNAELSNPGGAGILGDEEGDADTGTFEIVEYTLEASEDGGILTRTGFTVALEAVEDDKVFGGFDIDSAEVTIAGLSTSTVYEVFGGVPFLRGDAVQPFGRLTLGDGIRILNTIFTEQYIIGDCPAALDVNDDQFITLADGLGLMFHLFLPGAADPMPPFPDPGLDPDGELHCGPGPVTIDTFAED